MDFWGFTITNSDQKILKNCDFWTFGPYQLQILTKKSERIVTYELLGLINYTF